MRTRRQKNLVLIVLGANKSANSEIRTKALRREYWKRRNNYATKGRRRAPQEAPKTSPQAPNLRTKAAYLKPWKEKECKQNQREKRYETDEDLRQNNLPRFTKRKPFEKQQRRACYFDYCKHYGLYPTFPRRLQRYREHNEVLQAVKHCRGSYELSVGNKRCSNWIISRKLCCEFLWCSMLIIRWGWAAI